MEWCIFIFIYFEEMSLCLSSYNSATMWNSKYISFIQPAPEELCSERHKNYMWVHKPNDLHINRHTEQQK
jgi:hypothetical protein